ncbi:glycosyltransferase family 9 protein [Deinococcus sp. YIM 77859]|uniref:glycosyltransferase family 9 protein n=1 Tax=Deinococcus sp. YIM 77859 TaxID=1540221 RepID=UPI000AB7E88D|nr:glycosyltransferase family 9 protein [Deinococcus sp. YIM 77859]
MNGAWANLKNLLVMRLDNIGDVVMTAPVLRALKEALPGVRLTLMVSPAGANAVPLLPWVDDVIVWRAMWQQLGGGRCDPARELELIGLLRERRFDAAVLLTSFSQTPHPAALACLLAGIPLRLGEAKERAPGLLTHEPASPTPEAEHQVERNLRLLEAVGLPVRDRSLEVHIPQEARRQAAALLPGPSLLLNPFASCSARTYPPERAARAARLIAERAGLRVVVTGVAKDRERRQALLAELGELGVDLLGKTDLPTFAALIAEARLVLTNNTSALHLADAVRTPVLVTYSGTDYESQWRPRRTPALLLRRPTPCHPCYAFQCPFHLECLDIAPEEVAEAGLALLGQQSAASGFAVS